MPKVSVIIPAFNEEKLISKTISSIREQTFKDLELIVVDNCSTDDTIEQCNLADKILSYHEFNNPSCVRNYGAKNSDGECLVFLDADSSLSSTSIENAVKYMDSGFVGGRNIIKAPEEKLISKVQTFILNNWGRLVAPQYTPYIFCTKDAFLESGGWPEGKELGDELIFQRRLSKIGKLKYDSDSFVETSPRRYQKEGYLKITLLGVLAYYGVNSKWEPVRE